MFDVGTDETHSNEEKLRTLLKGMTYDELEVCWSIHEFFSFFVLYYCDFIVLLVI